MYDKQVTKAEMARLVLRERPILFSAPMVRAILDDRKPMTRRIVKPQPEMHDFGVGGIKPALTGKHVIAGMLAVGCDAAKGSMAYVRCPYGQPGDRLWVRETWAIRGNEDGHPEREDYSLCEAHEAPRFYRADCKQADYGMWELPDGSLFERWRPSIHMPRWASRITLEVTGVRVERLQDISEADARAEGISVLPLQNPDDPSAWWQSAPSVHQARSPRSSFALLWDSINAKRAPWSSNPWVWVVEFKRIKEAA